jgi:hypothetical protein
LGSAPDSSKIEKDPSYENLKKNTVHLVILQDSYALCRVFKKNEPIDEFEKQGECSTSQAKGNQEQVTDFEDAGESSGVNENDKDNSWMQFIVEDLWCSNKTK